MGTTQRRSGKAAHGSVARSRARTETPKDETVAIAALMSALACPLRLEVLAALSEGRRTVTQIACTLDLDATTVSYHLRKLRDIQTVSCIASGNERLYSSRGHCGPGVWEASAKIGERAYRVRVEFNVPNRLPQELP